jgi:hypothetical protein
MENRRTCKRCGKDKPISAFPKLAVKSSKGESYWEHRCSACKSRAYRAKNPEKVKEYRRKRLKRIKNLDPEKILQLTRQSSLRHAMRSARKKQELLKHIGQTSCSCCGFSDVRALCFHHRDPAIKEINISKGLILNYKIDRLKREVEKCDVYCLNCHAIRHSILRWGGEKEVPEDRVQGGADRNQDDGREKR